MLGVSRQCEVTGRKLFSGKVLSKNFKYLSNRKYSLATTKNGAKYESKKFNKAQLMAIAGAGLIATTTLLYSNFNSEIQNESKLAPKRVIDPSEVARHNTPADCWIVINGVVYDLTSFIPVHPGGADIIKSNAGKDVTAIFEPIHAPGVIEKYLPPKCRIGTLKKPMPAELTCDPYTPGESKDDIIKKLELRNNLPHLDSIINIYDFEKLASKILSNQAWAYYSSGADDEISYRDNHSAYRRIFFKPRILRDVSSVDVKTTMLGSKVDVPFYVSATALCKLGNPKEGEKDIARGCGQGDTKVPQMISTLASCSVDEIVDAAPSKDQIAWYQVYVNSDRNITRDMIKHVEKLGIKALFITVDAPSLGRREKDMKIKFSGSDQGAKVMKEPLKKVEKKDDGEMSKGASTTLSKFIDPSLTWDDVVKMRKWTKLPIVIKGVQSVEDVVKAAELGVDGVVLSNHGGRQLDYSRPPIEVLAETVPVLKEKHLDGKLELFVDGGVRRGTDVIKALCLGAKGVGLGRPFLYSNSCYGKDGVEKTIELLKTEIEMSMRLLGVTSIDQLTPELLDTTNLKSRTVNVSKDVLFDTVYRNPTLAAFQNGYDDDE
ncbi:hypothetical protein NCAS_0A02780 [Naumovozyma castellii]|uniref:L-lactate dehydrogenase (cytochrome) n=1 Tax=Naumovozyma castellii TaxID=27288 RepID=G0V5U8_NAUCA|nr:hypothetical protein NCAS_0A02780 [Naumovozyma castellii CBS 4309]CCC66836.1 hypothetical protein NCAS_0A02780 [Naumovozyma castellii CBS 4309]